MYERIHLNFQGCSSFALGKVSGRQRALCADLTFLNSVTSSTDAELFSAY